MEMHSTDEWSPQENNVFEVSLGELDLDGPTWLDQLTARLPGKTIDQVRDHFVDLICDLHDMVMDQSSFVEPNYGAIPDEQGDSTDGKGFPVAVPVEEDDIVLPSDEEMMEMENVLRELEEIIKTPSPAPPPAPENNE